MWYVGVYPGSSSGDWTAVGAMMRTGVAGSRGSVLSEIKAVDRLR